MPTKTKQKSKQVTLNYFQKNVIRHAVCRLLPHRRCADSIVNHLILMIEMADRVNTQPYFTQTHLAAVRGVKNRNAQVEIIKELEDAGFIYRTGLAKKSHRNSEGKYNYHGRRFGFAIGRMCEFLKKKYGRMWESRVGHMPKYYDNEPLGGREILEAQIAERKKIGAFFDELNTRIAYAVANVPARQCVINLKEIESEAGEWHESIRPGAVAKVRRKIKEYQGYVPMAENPERIKFIPSEKPTYLSLMRQLANIGPEMPLEDARRLCDAISVESEKLGRKSDSEAIKVASYLTFFKLESSIS